MFSFDHPQKSPLFDYFAPTNNSFRGILSIPHSGLLIPDEFRQYLCADERTYLEDVDYKVDELVDIPQLQSNGVGVFLAHIHRVCVDLNRSENQSVLFWKENTHGKKMVERLPDVEMTNHFIQTYHRPYFEILKAALLDLEKKKSKPVSMIDLHSMPSSPTAYHLKQNPQQANTRADFFLSDRKGLTCHADFINYFHQQFLKRNFKSALNDPYVGGYITEYVNQFRTNNIQIEINRSIYMDESLKDLIPHKSNELKNHLTEILISGFIQFDS
jgi:N-formylglutamate amidohydrolase